MRQATSAWRRNQRQTSPSLLLIIRCKKLHMTPQQLHMNPLKQPPPQKKQRQTSVTQFFNKLFGVWPHMNTSHTKSYKNLSPPKRWNQHQTTWLHSILETLYKRLITEHFWWFPPNHLLVNGQLESPWTYETVSRKFPCLVIKTFSAKVDWIQFCQLFIKVYSQSMFNHFPLTICYQWSVRIPLTIWNGLEKVSTSSYQDLFSQGWLKSILSTLYKSLITEHF